MSQGYRATLAEREHAEEVARKLAGQLPPKPSELPDCVPCAYCGKPFNTWERKRSFFCSPRCSNIVARARRAQNLPPAPSFAPQVAARAMARFLTDADIEAVSRKADKHKEKPPSRTRVERIGAVFRILEGPEFKERITALAAVARNSTLSDEVRYRALMEHTAHFWHRKSKTMMAEPADDFVEEAEERRHTPAPRPKRVYSNALSALTDIVAAPKNRARPKPPPPPTIKDYAVELVTRIDRIEDGVPLGLPYDRILAMIRDRFPTVTTKGAHFGKPTKMTVKDVQSLVFDLRRAGVAIPRRPNSPRTTPVRGTLATVEAADVLRTLRCVACGSPFTPAERIRRPPLYCSQACRQAACRARKAA